MKKIMLLIFISFTNLAYAENGQLEKVKTIQKDMLTSVANMALVYAEKCRNQGQLAIVIMSYKQYGELDIAEQKIGDEDKQLIEKARNSNLGGIQFSDLVYKDCMSKVKAKILEAI